LRRSDGLPLAADAYQRHHGIRRPSHHVGQVRGACRTCLWRRGIRRRDGSCAQRGSH
jgi:hypothetical protein